MWGRCRGGVTRSTFVGWDAENRAQYENGDMCTVNGAEKARRGDVRFECGKEMKLTQTSENPTCEYHFVVATPCACTEAVLEPLLAERRALEALLSD